MAISACSGSASALAFTRMEHNLVLAYWKNPSKESIENVNEISRPSQVEH
jgi:hypothetical protein